MRRILVSVVALATLALFCGAAPHGAADGGHQDPLGYRLPMASVGFFAAMLLAIALMPLAASRWWEHNANKAKLAALLSVPLVAFVTMQFGWEGLEAFGHTALEYISFMALLGSLFVISGGIFIQGSLAGTPLVNTAVLAIGAVLANVVGTTGASMLLIRPMIRANEGRRRVAHVIVFFIFIVSNCGGVLTPLGDPPLFLGYLAGVPFGWTLRLWPHWLFVNGALLAVFYVWDHVELRRDERGRTDDLLQELIEHQPLRIRGSHNFIFLFGIVAAVFAAGGGTGNGGHPWPYGIQEGLMVALGALSYFTTRPAIHEKNRFTFGPISEVAILFAGIFVTMTPALLILNANGARMGLTRPAQYFWASGLLSSFLDNAPTYLTFAATACGVSGIPLVGRYLTDLLATPSGSPVLAAISCGCVFMGANSYIGNGPNFMVKAIAEESNVRMPGFFGYMIYSMSVLVPLFGLVTLIFFRA